MISLGYLQGEFSMTTTSEAPLSKISSEDGEFLLNCGIPTKIRLAKYREH
jgi:hypothetical protein